MTVYESDGSIVESIKDLSLSLFSLSLSLSLSPSLSKTQQIQEVIVDVQLIIEIL